MQIIKDLNHVVLFVGENFTLTDKKLIAPGFTSPAIKSATHTIEEEDSVPDDFVGGHYTHDGEWIRTAMGEAAKSKRDADFMKNLYRQMEQEVDSYVDSVAVARGYLSRLTAMSYTSFENKWQSECLLYGAWFASCYEYCQQVYADVLAGARTIPTKAELIAELPEMVWPE